MAFRPYWIVTLLASAVLTGCATPVYDPDGHPNSPAYGHLKLPHLN